MTLNGEQRSAKKEEKRGKKAKKCVNLKVSSKHIPEKMASAI